LEKPTAKARGREQCLLLRNKRQRTVITTHRQHDKSIFHKRALQRPPQNG